MKFSKEGKGPVVVLSHALALDSGMWSEIATALSTGFTVVRYDHRGHGDRSGDAAPHSIEDLADDAAALIREVSDEPVAFVGLSLGGMVGQSLAARHPKLLRGLALVNTAAHYPDRTLWDSRMRTVSESGMQAVAAASIDRWLTPAFRQTPEGQAVASKLLEVLLRTPAQAYVHACEAIAGMDLRGGNRNISAPTLVIAGRQDMATPLSMSQDLVAAIPGARLAEVDAAHISAAEMPAEITLLLRRWLRTLPS